MDTAAGPANHCAFDIAASTCSRNSQSKVKMSEKTTVTSPREGAMLPPPPRPDVAKEKKMSASTCAITSFNRFEVAREKIIPRSSPYNAVTDINKVSMSLTRHTTVIEDNSASTREGNMHAPLFAIGDSKKTRMLPPPPRHMAEDKCAPTREGGTMPPPPSGPTGAGVTHMSAMKSLSSRDKVSAGTSVLRPLPSLKAGATTKSPSWEACGWKRVPSKSKPNSFSYLHVKTGLRQKQ